MPRYRVTRDFGSHLGNHYVGEVLNLPDGGLPRGFAGFVEPVAEPVQKDVVPASAQADDVLPDAGEPPAPASSEGDQVRAGYANKRRGRYSDKMLRADGEEEAD
jgi:hypothetical protein